MNNLNESLKRAEKALRKKKYDKAIKEFRICLNIDPLSVKTWSELAYSYNKINEYDKAVEACIRALELEPESKDILNNLFFAYDQKGDYDESLKILRQYTSIYPIVIEHPLNVHEKIIFYSENKYVIKLNKNFNKNCKDWNHSGLQDAYNSRIDELLPSFNPINIIPLNFLNYFKFSNIIKSEKNIDVLRLVVDIFPQKFQAWNKLGLAYAKKKDYNKSIEMFTQSLEINSEDANTWISLGDIYFQMKEFKKAMDAFNRAIKIDPEIREAWINLGNTYLSLGEYDNAINTLKKALEIYPSQSKIKRNLVELFPHYEKFNVKIIYKMESTKYIWYYIAKAYYKTRNYDKALEASRQSLKISPNFDKALELKRKISSLKKK